MDTRGTSRPKMAVIVFLLLQVWIASSTAATDNLYPEFDVRFTDFLRENGYRGGAVAAMKDGRLVLARGYGHDRAGHVVSAYSKFPVSSIAKSLTGVAILHLVEDGALSLDDTVFGDDGVLSYIRPWREGEVDPRLYDMTVGHLLHHTAGWDNSQGPLYDPLFNIVYHDRGHKVPSIAVEMGKETAFESLDPEELISYVISFPLHYSPGTVEAYSNVGYLALGRVIEALTGVEYRDYIKRLILEPCGMWNTRLELSHYVEDDLRAAADHDPSVMTFLDPVSIDSSLGWHSNVYDIMRFSRCLFHSKKLLGDQHLDLLLSKPAAHPTPNSNTWYGGGFRVSDKQVVWQDADLHTDDLILFYHKPTNIHNTSSSSSSSYHEHDRRNKADLRTETILDQFASLSSSSSTSSKSQDVPDSWVILLCDKGINHIRHKSREIMTTIKPSLLLDDEENSENIFLYDLSELHRHPSWEDQKSQVTPQITVRYKVDEHHLTAYVNALKSEGFSLYSFSSLIHHGHTFFLLAGKKETTRRSDADFIFEHGMDHRQLKKTKLRLEEFRYNMTLLHSYKSQSHAQQYVFAALFNYEAFAPDMQMKYGTSHLPEPYQKLVQMYHEQQFHPLSETVVYQGKDERFSFVFIKKIGGTKVDFKQYYNLSPARLSRLTVENARRNLHVSYLNGYSVSGKPRLSAVFTNATHYRGVLEVNQPASRATEITIMKLQGGMTPKQMVPYYENDDDYKKGKLKIVAYYEEV